MITLRRTVMHDVRLSSTAPEPVEVLLCRTCSSRPCTTQIQRVSRPKALQRRLMDHSADVGRAVGEAVEIVAEAETVAAKAEDSEGRLMEVTLTWGVGMSMSKLIAWRSEVVRSMPSRSFPEQDLSAHRHGAVIHPGIRPAHVPLGQAVHTAQCRRLQAVCTLTAASVDVHHSQYTLCSAPLVPVCTVQFRVTEPPGFAESDAGCWR
ncbi:hypothetical protein EYF80_050744 [Liparis tanakae]|uniref:Uncharacterized protein n=1 Tax=Liparis tanakae TaxID=230148 RepID=A0A4Z2FDW2_9TELE|nr:hypothetical protein EYF80_050744 [Liparis tanakae]